MAGIFGVLSRLGVWRITSLALLAAAHLVLTMVNGGAYMVASTAVPTQVVLVSKLLFVFTVVGAIPVELTTSRVSR